MSYNNQRLVDLIQAIADREGGTLDYQGTVSAQVTVVLDVEIEVEAIVDREFSVELVEDTPTKIVVESNVDRFEIDYALKEAADSKLHSGHYSVEDLFGMADDYEIHDFEILDVKDQVEV